MFYQSSALCRILGLGCRPLSRIHLQNRRYQQIKLESSNDVYYFFIFPFSTRAFSAEMVKEVNFDLGENYEKLCQRAKYIFTLTQGMNYSGSAQNEPTLKYTRAIGKIYQKIRMTLVM